MPVSRAYGHLRAFEGHMADLYDLFAELLHADSEVSALFSRLAMEERSHVSEVAYLARILTTEGDAIGSAPLDEEGLLVTTARVKRLRESAAGMTVNDALKAAQELEESAAEWHKGLALRQTEPALARVLEHLGSDDVDHRERLATLARRRLGEVAPAAP